MDAEIIMDLLCIYTDLATIEYEARQRAPDIAARAKAAAGDLAAILDAVTGCSFAPWEKLKAPTWPDAITDPKKRRQA